MSHLAGTVRSPMLHASWRACWVTHGPVGLTVIPAMWTFPRAMLDEEEYVEPTEEHGVHREEVASQEVGCLGSEERTPGRTRSRRRGLGAVALQDAPDA
jgi:hypothetical protein